MKNFCRGLAFCFCPVGRLYETGLSTAEAGCRTLFLRLKRECGFVVPPQAALFYLATHLDIHYFFFSRMAGPDWVSMARKRTEG